MDMTHYQRADSSRAARLSVIRRPGAITTQLRLMRGLCRRGGLVLAATASGAAALAAVTAAPAAATTTPRAVQIRLPANAGANPRPLLIGVGCTSAGFCAAGGTYTDTAGRTEAMAVPESRGRWARAVELRLPSDAEVNPFAEVNSVACTGTGSCVAVGYYNGDTRFQGFIAAASGGTWRRARLAPVPPNTAAATDFQLNGVSCSAPGVCLAVGNYRDRSGHFQAMALAESRGRWGPARELPMPANAAPDPGAFILGVACPGTGSCVVTADYTDRSGRAQVAILAESAGRWRSPAELRLPPDAAPTPFAASLNSVTCARLGSCLALGHYDLTSGGFSSMVATESSGRWGRLVKLSLRPAGAAVWGPDLIGIACQGSAACVAAGGYKDTAGGFPPMIATWSAGRWTRADRVTLPANAAAGAGQSSHFYAVSCPRAGSCWAVGFYTDNLGHIQAMAAATPP
jgi:hypothetical protein